MKVRILDKSKVKHDGAYLEKFEVYDLSDDIADQLVAAGDAEKVDPSKPASDIPEAAPKTPKFDKKKGYVAEAVIDPEKKAKLEAEGKLNDEIPVTGQDHTLPVDATLEPEVKTEVLGEDGHVLTDEEIVQRDTAARAGTKTEANPTVTVAELQNSGSELK